ncbi:MAG TPA: glycoside hydrolase domain-containing protein [Candidatus Deferrimicrobiaceae bacterium]|nr:glycoside hydrolase domain-containing protein [Candidatus Deferrimicrobiaceae bacterium]
MLDYSAGFPGAAAIKAAGYAGAVRYIGTPGNRKCATADELDDFNAHGLGMALVFEQTAGQWRSGFEQGRRDAQAARHHADAIGWPRNRPIYMAIDQDVVTEEEYRAVGRYLDGAGEVLGRDLTGPYGEYEVCRRSAEWGFPWQWQCRAWSGIDVIQHFDGRRLYQYFGHPDGGPNPEVGGVDCDVNEVDHPDWGQHNYAAQEDALYAFDVQEIPAGPVEAPREAEIVWPPLDGATRLKEAWVSGFVPAGTTAVFSYAHWNNAGGTRLDGPDGANYLPDSTTVQGPAVLSGKLAPKGAAKLVLVYTSTRALKFAVEVRD